jgi:hypothetical protein
MNWDNLFHYARIGLEMLSLVSGIALAALGFAVFRQLKLSQESLEAAKNDLQIRVKREAVILAAEQVEKFGKEVLPKAAEIIDAVRREGIKIEEWKLENNLLDETTIKDFEAANRWLRTLQQPRTSRLIQILNNFESFSMYFAEGAADERIAYPSVASVYCSYVRELAPLLISLRLQKANIVSGPYQNIVTLYDKWASRLRKAELEAQAAKLKAESSGIHITEIPLIGESGKG